MKRAKMPDKDLNALFLHQLKDTYYAENAIAKALPRFAEAAKTNELKAALTIHAEETRNQVRRLDQVFKLLDADPAGIECKAIEGILAEGDEVMEEFSEALQLMPD
jgi:ferritin-like metal-binding protein YciE